MLAARVRTMERPCSKKENQVKICGLYVSVHGVEFLRARRETERPKEDIAFSYATIPLQSCRSSSMILP